MEKHEKETWMSSGLILPGCMFVGMGLGMLFNVTHIGLFIGLGTGFIFIGIVKMISAKESNRSNETN